MWRFPQEQHCCLDIPGREHCGEVKDWSMMKGRGAGLELPIFLSDCIRHFELENCPSYTSKESERQREPSPLPLPAQHISTGGGEPEEHAYPPGRGAVPSCRPALQGQHGVCLTQLVQVALLRAAPPR